LKIAILRFSAIGDVLLLLPVVANAVAQYPNCTITIYTKKNNAVFFEAMPNVSVHACDFENNYSGLQGLLYLANNIRKQQYDVIMDCHNVLRTQFLRIVLKPFVSTLIFEKLKQQKQAFIDKKNTEPIIHTVIRYASVFEKNKMPLELKNKAPYINIANNDKAVADVFFEKHSNAINIGLAPFASHANKMLPNATILNFLALCNETPDIKVFVFGAPADQTIIDRWASQYSCVVKTNTITFIQQIALQQKLQKMICVDSANMHIAALQNISLISIWCATHPDLGFAPWQAISNIVVSDTQLACRPCSVFGNKKCTNKIENLCAKNISAQDIFMATMA
jgi:ADP-heptose:LPS heptosyltransferase